MSDLLITAGPYRFKARLETEKAPLTCAAFLEMLPFSDHLLHVRWSGEATWIPLGSLSLSIPAENATTYPLPGEILFYPGGVSETEILIPYGRTQFGSKAGLLAGNHFLTIVDGAPHLADLGRMTLWNGAQSILFDRYDD
jgi:Protein of unknown function (DUF3830)